MLTVRDIEVTCDFYRRALGMEVVTFAEGRKALVFGQEKSNLHQVGKELEPKADCGLGRLLPHYERSDRASDEHLIRCGVQILDGPVQRAGAVDPILSIYFRDPDLNLVEVSNYSTGT